MITNESAFFNHIASQIKKLTSAYSSILGEIENEGLGVSAATIDYALLIQRLNRAITYFKTEMRECLQEYSYMKNMNILRDGYSLAHIKNELLALRIENEMVSSRIPENELRQGLGKNFYFHKNINKLTSETILDYFEMNYTLNLDNTTE